MIKVCWVCGNKFDTTKTGRYKYCSLKCAKSRNNNNYPRDLSAFRFNEPMQVELEGDGYADGELVYDFGKCPNCGWEFEDGDKDWEEPYCCHCGQKLHWFETQEVKDAEQWQELKETIIELRDNNGTATQQETCKFLANLMDVLEKQITDGWIPVSERLPKNNMPCLVSVGEFFLTQIAMYSDLMGTIDHKIFYIGDYGEENFEDITKYVKAWMPLPEPYKASPTGEEVEE